VEKHLAFLPITTSTDEISLQPYLDGLAEIITSRLTQMEKMNGEIWIVPYREICRENITSVADARREFGKKLRQIDSGIVEGQLSEDIALQDNILNELLTMLEIKADVVKTKDWLDEQKINPAAYDLYLSGIGHLQKSDIPENLNAAIELLRKSVGIDPQFSLAHAKLGEAYWRKFEITKDIKWGQFADSHCQQALKINSNNPVVLVCNGYIQSGTGKPQEAISSFRQALTHDSMYADAYRGLARAQETIGRFEEAEEAYRKSIQFQPAYWKNYNSLGVFYYRQGRYRDAVVQFQKVTDLTPESGKGYLNLGGIYFFLEDWEKAKEAYLKAEQIDPNEQVYRNLGALNFYLKQYAQSALWYEKALAISDRDYPTWAGLAEAYHWQGGQETKSISCYRQAIRLAEQQLEVNPGDLEIMSELGSYYATIADTHQAQQLLKTLVTKNPENVETYFRIGETYELLGERQQALSWIDKAIQGGYSTAIIEAYPGLKSLREDRNYPSFKYTGKHAN
jgi:tetratricopeptide (TPR) repeat protein